MNEESGSISLFWEQLFGLELNIPVMVRLLVRSNHYDILLHMLLVIQQHYESSKTLNLFSLLFYGIGLNVNRGQIHDSSVVMMITKLQ